VGLQRVQLDSGRFRSHGNGKLPTEVQKSFDGHDCAKFARMIGSKAKRRDLPTA
jgi:hypothetical protein